MATMTVSRCTGDHRGRLPQDLRNGDSADDIFDRWWSVREHIEIVEIDDF